MSELTVVITASTTSVTTRRTSCVQHTPTPKLAIGPIGITRSRGAQHPHRAVVEHTGRPVRTLGALGASHEEALLECHCFCQEVLLGTFASGELPTR
jgi:hypothetical protein